MMINLLKSILHNVGVVIVGLALAYLGTMIDSLLGAPTLNSTVAAMIGALLLALGFLLRLWATVYFYAHSMRVISLEPQASLITSGPYRFSRNPLYLGGNVFIFSGAALLLGSQTALVAMTRNSIHSHFCAVASKRCWSTYLTSLSPSSCSLACSTSHCLPKRKIVRTRRTQDPSLFVTAEPA